MVATEAPGETTTESAPAANDPGFASVAGILFADRANPTGVALAACPEHVPAEARVRCLFDARYRGDARAASLAHELWSKWRVIAGVDVAHAMDGGFRGKIRLEPAVPIKAERKHLEWIVAAFVDFDAFFRELEGASVTREAGARRETTYRFRPLTLRFVRSVGRTTPSAYAQDWTIGWNLAGSLHTSGDTVRETLFHEIFHLNDGARDGWSRRALSTIYGRVVATCAGRTRCLEAYTPNSTMVRGGTYYAFQQANGDSVAEYAAELALRFYREQRAALRGSTKVPAFKCGPPENARAWELMRDEFFGGRDAVPPC